MVLIGLYVRIKLHETPVFARAVERGEKLKAPLVQVLRSHSGALLRGAFIMIANYGLFYLMTTWILSYAIGNPELGFLGIDYQKFLILQLVSVLLFAAFIPVSGRLADRIGRRPLLIAVTGAIILFGLSFGYFLSPAAMGSGASANLGLMLVFLSLGMSLTGLIFGPMSALLPELFPTNIRYTGSGIAYNMASILGAALTPFVATWLASHYGPGSVGLYLACLGAMTLIALLLSKETRTTNLETMEEEAATAAIEATSP